jgi:hypothetical protein
MTEHRSTSGRDTPAPIDGATGGADGDSGQDPFAELVRVHGAAPPYDAVEWKSLVHRVMGDAEGELERRRVSAAARAETMAHRAMGRVVPFDRGAGVLFSARTSGVRRLRGRWFEVTAGWVGPAMVAAAVVTGIAVTLNVTVPLTPGMYGAGDSAGALVSASQATYGDDAQAGDSAMEAAVVGRAPDQQVDLELGPKTSDALLTAVVEER